MSVDKLLLKKTEEYRIETLPEVEQFMEELKQDASEKGYELSSVTRTFKQKKSKGEIVGEAYQVKVVKTYETFWYDF